MRVEKIIPKFDLTLFKVFSIKISEQFSVSSTKPLKMFRHFDCRDHVNGRSRSHSQASLSSLHGGQRSSQAATPETVRLLQASLMADSDRESRLVNLFIINIEFSN